MRRRHPADEGASMVLVLVVVVFAALVSTAFLTKSDSELKASSAYQRKVQLQYGADAGLEKGIQALRDDLASNLRTKCLTPFEPTTSLATFTWTGEGHSVSVTCRDLQGVAARSTALPSSPRGARTR
jgi:type II secretory pathway component PulK